MFIPLLLLLLEVSSVRVPVHEIRYDRSGDILVSPHTHKLSYISDITTTTSTSTGTGGSLAQRVECSLGVTSHQGDPFQANRANLVIAVQGLDKDTARNLQLNTLISSDARSNYFHRSFTQDELAFMNSLVTAESSVVHGVVGRVWTDLNGKLVSAYCEDDLETHRLVPNIADVVTEQFDGKPLVFSAAMSAQESLTFGAKNSKNAVNMFFKNGKLSSDYSDALDITQEDVTRFFTDSSSSLNDVLKNYYGAKLAFDSYGNILSLNLGEKTIQFDLNDENDKDLAWDIALAVIAPQRIQKSSGSIQSLVQDDAPDMYAITFTSLKSYLNNPDKLAAAAILLDSASHVSIREFSELYHDRIGVQSIGIASYTPEDYNIDALSKHDLDTSLLPHVYLRDKSVEQISKTCKELSQSTSIFCPSSHGIPKHFISFADSSVSSAANYTVVTDSDVQLYQISLWLTVALILALFFAVYALAFMENKKDSILYTRFNPGTGKRK